MSVFDDIDAVEKAFTKESVLQSVLDTEKNGWDVVLHITEYPKGHELSSYITLLWQLSDDTPLRNSENTKNYDLEWLTASFDCDISKAGKVRTIAVAKFNELEVEHADSAIGLDGSFYIGRDGQLGLTPMDFDMFFEKALSKQNIANTEIKTKASH